MLRAQRGVKSGSNPSCYPLARGQARFYSLYSERLVPSRPGLTGHPGKASGSRQHIFPSQSRMVSLGQAVTCPLSGTLPLLVLSQHPTLTTTLMAAEHHQLFREMLGATWVICGTAYSDTHQKGFFSAPASMESRVKRLCLSQRNVISGRCFSPDLAVCFP